MINRMWPAVHRCSSLVTVGVALACGDAPPPPQAIVRDSAGIRIVELGPLVDRAAFQLGEPVYRLGWSDTDHNFGQVVTGVLLSEGRAAVGDWGSDEVVVLTSAGTVEAVLGGSGQGPEEIGSLTSLSRLPGDTLVLRDSGNGRISFIHEGQWVRSYRSEVAYLLTVVGLQDRNLVMVTSGYRPGFDEPWFQGSIVRHPLETQQFDTVRSFDWVSRMSRGETSLLPAWGSVGVTAGALLITRGDRAQVEVLDLEGRTTQIIRWTERSRTVTDDLWAEYAENMRSGIAGDDADVNRFLAEGRAATDELPYLSFVHGDTEGRVWVSEYSLPFRYPERYRVFDRAGDWLGWVSMPPRVEILDIGSDMILAIQRNDFDVEAIVLLPLQAGGAVLP